MNTIRYIILNFKFTDQRSIPNAFRAIMEDGDTGMSAVRCPAPKGVKLSETNGHRAIGNLVHDIMLHGFRLSRVRTFAKNNEFLVRCSFATEGEIAPPALLTALNALCGTTLWRARTYRNLALREGIIIPETSDINIAFAYPKKIERSHRAPLSLDAAFF